MPSAKVRIALVDDDRAFLEKMKGYAGQAAEEEKVDCIVETFSDSVAFLDGFSAVYDMIFLDIEMPGADGLETARRIRKVDESVSLIFVTNMAQYAINGYEVNALDFIVKPVEYYTFLDKFRKALRFQSTRREKTALMEGEDGIVRVPFSQIYYLEKDKNKNYIIYHTSMGEFRERGTIARKEGEFLSYGFGKCSSGCLVNLRHVQKIRKDTVWVAGEAIPVSRSHQKTLYAELMRYLGGEQ